MNMNELTAQNTKFLREKVGITIAELSETLDIDPIDLHLIEKGGNNFGVNQMPLTDALCSFGTYFTVSLDDLFFTDLSIDKTFDLEIIKKIINERNEGVPYNRRNFKERILKGIDINQLQEQQEQTEDEERQQIIKNILFTIHMSSVADDRYFYLRKNGLIERSSWFEPE